MLGDTIGSSIRVVSVSDSTQERTRIRFVSVSFRVSSLLGATRLKAYWGIKIVNGFTQEGVSVGVNKVSRSHQA